MLRSFDLVTTEISPLSVVAVDDDYAALMGGGDSYAAPWHWHDCLSFLVPTTGVLHFQAEDRSENNWLSKDRFLAVPAFVAHDTISARDAYSHLALFVTDGALHRLESEVGSFGNLRRKLKTTGVFPLTREIRSLQRLCDSSEHNGRAATAIKRHLGLALLLKILEEVENSGPVSTATSADHGKALVAEVKDLLDAHVGRDLPLSEIAHRFSISPRHLTRLFRETVGLTIGDFQQLKRIDAARQLLINTDLPIGEIAYRVGFESGSSLARAMRRSGGDSPGKVRMSMARSA
jgi:AraC family transcriptional regulator